MTSPVSSTAEQQTSSLPMAVQLGRGAQVVRIVSIDAHPDADHLVILDLSNGVSLVSGPHYEAGQLGVYIAAPVIIPGWLAEDLWMVKKGDRWVVVEPRIMRGVPSPGLFAGMRWRNAPDRDWQLWPLWRSRWKEGDDVSHYLGIASAVSANAQNSPTPTERGSK